MMEKVGRNKKQFRVSNSIRIAAHTPATWSDRPRPGLADSGNGLSWVHAEFDEQARRYGPGPAKPGPAVKDYLTAIRQNPAQLLPGRFPHFIESFVRYVHIHDRDRTR